jgi:hypothetical protein
MQIQLHAWEWVVTSHSGLPFPGECTPGIHWIKSLSRRDALRVEKIPCPFRSPSWEANSHPAFCIDRKVHYRVHKSLPTSWDSYWLTGWTIGWSGFESRRGLGIFPFTTASRTALEPTQPTIQWVPGALYPGKAAVAWSWPLTCI